VTQEIETKLKNKNIAAIGQIPYDTSVTKAQIAGRSIIEYSNNGLSDQIKSLWRAILDTFTKKDSDNG
jgi:CO dehydrogenase nickel-insertion accessory protein CooC1